MDNATNIASWDIDSNAEGYEVVIDNGDIRTTNSNSIKLDKGSHISVRTIYGDGSKSNWSIPKANINIILEDEKDDKYVYIYFADSNVPSMKLERGQSVDSISLQGDGIKTFGGWYLDIGCKNKVTFPYVVNKNITFYPKWDYPSDVYTRDYYNLVDQSGKVIDGFIWNYDNYDFYEYELKEKVLDEKTYYVKSLDNKTTYETFSIGKKGTYSIYFSEDKLWTDQEVSRHVFIRHDKIDVYFTNNKYWSGTIYAYLWNGNDIKVSWPGVKMDLVNTNSYGESIYRIQVDLVQYNNLIFTNGSKQTVDISINGINTNQGYYCNSESNGKWTIGKFIYTK